MNDLSILAVVVTHNRCHLLSRCLDHILNQTRRPNQVLVINNGSTDNTVEMLEERGISFITQGNSGSAGGWYRALKYAIEHRFNAVWLMDDDGFPDQCALEVLEEALTTDTACAASVVVREDSPSTFVFPMPVLDSAKMPVIFAWKRKLKSMAELRNFAVDGTYPFAHFFNGSLISTFAAEQVGDVDQNFFIYGDELDYHYRLRNAGRVISVLNAVHYHPDQGQRPFTNMKIYYYIKNTFILNHRYFRWPWVRNVLTILVLIARVAKRNSTSDVLSLLIGKHAPMFYSAMKRGLRGDLGKDFYE